MFFKYCKFHKRPTGPHAVHASEYIRVYICIKYDVRPLFSDRPKTTTLKMTSLLPIKFSVVAVEKSKTRGQGGHLCFPINSKNTVEGVKT